MDLVIAFAAVALAAVTAPNGGAVLLTLIAHSCRNRWEHFAFVPDLLVAGFSCEVNTVQMGTEALSVSPARAHP